MAKMGRPPKDSKYVPRGRGSYRFSVELLKAIKQGAKRKKVSQNDYVEEAIRMRLEADGVRVPERLEAPFKKDKIS